MSDIVLTLEDSPADADVAEVARHLAAYNVAMTGRPYDRTPLAVFLRADGDLLGGLTGATNWGWLVIDCLWLRDELRGGGWGSRLLEAAEGAARARGCRAARLYTYDFQALDFYRRHGYELFGTLDDYPPGHSQHWLRKRLG